MGNKFMNVEEVAGELGVSVSYAYKLIRKLNKELREKGFITIDGRGWGPNRIDSINGDESRYCIICEYPSSKTTREPYEITEIINEWDPIGLFPAAPDDEYHSETEQIRQALEMSDDPEQIAEKIWSAFAESFGTEVFQKTKEECKQIAERLMNRLP